MITILTPAYNRSDLIKRTYQSLLRQTSKNFEWIVVDDGSTDSTKQVIEKFKKEKKINIRYIYKENGGKHTALNVGIPYAKGEFLVILDSDDYLVDDAIAKIEHYTKKYKNEKEIASFTFLKVFPNQEVIGKTYHGSEIIANPIDFRYNEGHLGDMAEVFRTSILKQFPFPEYPHERFLSEAIVWNKIALQYQSIYINEPIMVCEYMEGGLSDNTLLARIKSPIGSLENAKLFMNPRFKMNIRFKNAILYVGFSLVAKRSVSQIFHESSYFVLTLIGLIPGALFFLYLQFIKRRKR